MDIIGPIIVYSNTVFFIANNHQYHVYLCNKDADIVGRHIDLC